MRIWALIPLFFALPSIAVNWSDTRGHSFNIVVSGREEILEQCARSGIEVRYRYQIHACKKRSWWFDRCRDDAELVQSLQYDPISENIRVMTDRMGDSIAPEITHVATIEEAFDAISTIKGVPLASIDSESKSSDDRDYVSVRLISDCKGEYSQVAKRISTILTLGLIKVGSFDSGWVDFELHSGSQQKK